MPRPDRILLARRDLLRLGLVAGAVPFLQGCRGRQVVQGAEASLPASNWPDQKGPLTPTPPLSTPAPIVSDAPSGIVPRSRWTNAGTRASGEKYLMNGVSRITIHHTAMDSRGLDSMDSVAHQLSAIRNEHLRRDARYIDIGYHYIIDPAGRVWEGRSTSLQGAHVSGKNEHNLGICVMGNFDIQRPTQEQYSALNAFVTSQMRRFNVSTGRVYTHQELDSTRCPGTNLQRYMLSARSRSGSLWLG